MPPTTTDADDRGAVFDAFGHDDAFALGTLLTERARRLGKPSAVDIRTQAYPLFHASVAGGTADNEAWILRKAATALRFERSTQAVAAMLTARPDAFTSGWLDGDRYAPVGGSVPIRVAGAGLVCVVTVSGVGSPDDDHRFVVDAIEDYRAARAAGTRA